MIFIFKFFIKENCLFSLVLNTTFLFFSPILNQKKRDFDPFIDQIPAVNMLHRILLWGQYNSMYRLLGC